MTDLTLREAWKQYDDIAGDEPYDGATEDARNAVSTAAGADVEARMEALEAALWVSESAHRSTATLLRDLHNDHIEWKRIPRRIRDDLEQWVITAEHIADRDRAVLADPPTEEPQTALTIAEMTISRTAGSAYLVTVSPVTTTRCPEHQPRRLGALREGEP